MGLYYTYMVRCEDGSIYTGIAADVARRMAEHRSRSGACAKYTRTHPVVGLAGLWSAPNRSWASRLEYRIKQLSRTQKDELLADPCSAWRHVPGADGTTFSPVDPVICRRLWNGESDAAEDVVCAGEKNYPKAVSSDTERTVNAAERSLNERLSNQGGIVSEKLLVLCYPKCSTCKKATKWLDEHGVEYDYRDIVTENPTAAELAAWHQASGLPIRRFFNTSGQVYRNEGIKARLDAGMSDEECYELLSTNGMLVKRPLVVGEGVVLTGFREEQWAASLL